MNNEHTFLIYDIQNEDSHKRILLDHYGMSSEEIQFAINLYRDEMGILQKENQRLNKLVDELLNELKYYKDFKMKYDEKYSSGY
jgi:cell division septum initiation protein DivIVA